MATTKNAMVIFDVGKSYNKSTAVDLDNGSILTSNRCESTSYHTGEYLAIDVETIWQYFLSQLKIFNKQFSIQQIIVTTHGATAALIDDSKLVFAVMDYEFDEFSSINSNYEKIRPAFAKTGSKSLPMGLNLGRQLFWMQSHYPEKWRSVKNILMLPQYFVWKLTGKCVSELTSLGCHTDLWNYQEHCFSSLISECKWGTLFPNMAGCGEKIGSISKDVAKKTGLQYDTIVLNGIHDSNATLVPYLQSKEQPLNIISSGTWTVINSILEKYPKHPLTEILSNEMMISMSFQGLPIPSIRFMGGREWELLQPLETSSYEIDEIKQLINLSCFPLPSYTNSGPFSEQHGTITGEIFLSKQQRAAVPTLYIALMTRYCLDLLDNSGDIIIEGSFVSNKKYLKLLQALSPNQNLFVSQELSGTTSGASRLSPNSQDWLNLKFDTVDKIRIQNLDSYYQRWILAINNQPNKL